MAKINSKTLLELKSFKDDYSILMDLGNEKVVKIKYKDFREHLISQLDLSGSSAIEVANYSALPDPTDVPGQSFIALAEQGTQWLPGSLGGTYYPEGYYYSNGISYIYSRFPYNASQNVTNAGTNNTEFLTPHTFTNSSQLASKANISGQVFTGSILATNLSGTNTGDQSSIGGISGSKSQFNDSLTDGDFLYVGDIIQYTDEMTQDAVGSMIDGTLVYVDSTPLLTRAALTGVITSAQGSNTTSLGSFTTSQLNSALSDSDVATGGGTAIGTNTGDQTSIVGITGTKAQFNTAVTDGNIVYVGDVVGSYPITYQQLTSLTLNEQLIPNSTTGPLGTFSVTANRCYLTPFVLGMDYTVTKLAVEVTTLGLTSTFYLGIYQLDPTTFIPTGAAVAETSGLSGTTTGLKTGTLAAGVPLIKGTLYGISILSNVSIVIRGVTAMNWYGGSVGTPSMVNSSNELRSAGFTSMPTNFSPNALTNGIVQMGIALYRN